MSKRYISRKGFTHFDIIGSAWLYYSGQMSMAEISEIHKISRQNILNAYRRNSEEIEALDRLVAPQVALDYAKKYGIETQ